MHFNKQLREKLFLNRSTKGGFTLVELIVVIAILGILGGVAVPAYSGYVKKAETAADTVLLDSIGMAFATACIGEGEANPESVKGQIVVLEDGALEMDGSAVKMAVSGMQQATASDLAGAFNAFYQGNVSNKFKAAKSTKVFVTGDGKAELGSSSGGIVVDPADVRAYLASTWGTLGTGTVMGMVDSTMSSVEAAWGASYYGELIASDTFRADAAAALGVADYEAYVNMQVEAAAKAKYEKENPGASWDALENYEKNPLKTEIKREVQSNVNANAAALVAAQKAAGQADAVIALLQSSTGNGAKDTIKGLLNVEDSKTTGLAQAAVAYGMYKSYIYSNDDIEDADKERQSSPTVALNNLGDAGFKAYLETQQGKDDLAGLLAAMNAINQQDNTVKQEAVNGGTLSDNTSLGNALDALLGK